MLSQSYNSTVPSSLTPPPPARYHISFCEALIAEKGLSPPFLLVKPGGETVATLVSENNTEDYVHNIAHKASFSIARIPRISSFLRTRGLRGTQPYYHVSVPVNGQTQNRVFLVSKTLASKMWNRYCARPQIYSAHEASERSGTEERYCLPGIQCYPFLSARQHAVSRKLLSGEMLLNWIAPNSLYELWKITCGVSTELFADCFNESGVVNAYCSADAEDEQFGSIGTWESNEKEISAAGANPPFAPHTLQNVICMFEEGVQKSVPYLKCAVLPIGKQYDILGNFNSLNFERLLLVTIPAGCFPFKNQMNFMSGDCVKEKPSMHQTLGLFVW